MFHYTADTTDIFKKCLSLRIRQQRVSLITDHRFIRKHTDDQTSQSCCLSDNCNMTTVQHICGKTHIHSSVFYFFEHSGHLLQIFRIINLGTKPVLYIQRTDQTLIGYFVKRIFRIT